VWPCWAHRSFVSRQGELRRLARSQTSGTRKLWNPGIISYVPRYVPDKCQTVEGHCVYVVRWVCRTFLCVESRAKYGSGQGCWWRLTMGFTQVSEVLERVQQDVRTVGNWDILPVSARQSKNTESRTFLDMGQQQWLKRRDCQTRTLVRHKIPACPNIMS
jgi:hypothetical protein